MSTVASAEPPLVISTEGRNPEAVMHSPTSGREPDGENGILRAATRGNDTSASQAIAAYCRAAPRVSFEA